MTHAIAELYASYRSELCSYLATAQFHDDAKGGPVAVPGTFHVLVIAQK